MMGKNNPGFCLYKPDGSAFRYVESASEMQTMFSNVLDALHEEQSKRYAEPPVLSATNETVMNALMLEKNRNAASALPPPAEESTAAGSADGPAPEIESRRARKRKASAEEPSSTPIAAAATRRSRRQSSARLGGKSSDEGLMSLTYSYGSMDWDAIEMCWKPKTGTKRKSRSSTNSGSKPSAAAKLKQAPPNTSRTGTLKPSVSKAESSTAAPKKPDTASVMVLPKSKSKNGKKKKIYRCEVCRERISRDKDVAIAHEVQCVKQMMEQKQKNDSSAPTDTKVSPRLSTKEKRMMKAIGHQVQYGKQMMKRKQKNDSSASRLLSKEQRMLKDSSSPLNVPSVTDSTSSSSYSIDSDNGIYNVLETCEEASIEDHENNGVCL